MAGVKGMRDKLMSSPQRAELWRAGVRIGLIRNRLMKHFLGELELTPTKLRAAEILISKTLPNMAQVEHTGEVTQRYVMELPTVAKDADEWIQRVQAKLPSALNS